MSNVPFNKNTSYPTFVGHSKEKKYISPQPKLTKPKKPFEIPEKLNNEPNVISRQNIRIEKFPKRKKLLQNISNTQKKCF